MLYVAGECGLNALSECIRTQLFPIEDGKNYSVTSTSGGNDSVFNALTNIQSTFSQNQSDLK